MVLYSEYSINKSRHNSKNKKYLINIYFLVAIIMICIFTISALSVLNYSINYDYKIDPNNNNNYNNDSITILDLEIQKNNSCAYCKDLINIINLEYEKYGKTIEDIVDIIKNICTFIHAPIVSQECVFISNNIEKILNWTSSGMNSTLICRKLNLCSNLSKMISS